MVSSYTVADKRQVEVFDPLIFQEDNNDIESMPCPICNTAGHEDVLLICDGCESNYHTHCIGIDRIPVAEWFCMECVAEGAINYNSALVERSSRVAAHDPLRQRPQRTQGQARRARRARTSQWQGAWSQITSRVWEHLNLDLDFNEDDHALVDFRRHTAIIDRNSREWQQRLLIASRQGARELFQDAAPPILHRAREEPVAQPQETAEEVASWRAMERAQELEEAGSTTSRKRKSRSATTSPSEPPAEPERKLKRPRTRRVLDAGATSDSAAESSSHRRCRRSIPTRRPEQQASSPSFLSSLLAEVQSSPAPDSDNRYTFDASSAIIPFSDQSSRAVSPASSNFSTPRGMSITPPPPKERHSPTPLTSHVMPNFPATSYSPTRAPPESEACSLISPPAPELRMPRPRNRNHTVVQRSDETSPTRSSMSLEAKEEINKIVKSALKRYWRPGGISKEQYVEVNKLVSRILYDKIQDPLDETCKGTWEKIAQTEVAKAVKGFAS